MKVKYPRTPHLPWSPGKTNDDKVLQDINCFFNKNIVVLEKMDGENTTMTSDSIYARSLDSADHPSRHWVKGLWGNIKYDIPQGWRICGENLYAKHSIGYDDLESYFEVFSIWNENNICLNWRETIEWCNLLGLKTVPMIAGIQFSPITLKEFSKEYNTSIKEGYVIRNKESFHFDKFSENVAKWVRSNHVITDDHWMQQKIIPNQLKTKI